MKSNSLFCTSYHIIVALFVSMLLLACGSGGGDRAGIGAGNTYSVKGVVSGVADAAFYLNGGSTLLVAVASNGSYNFEKVANGNYTVTPVKAGYTFNPASFAITVKDGNVTIMKCDASPATVTYTLSGKVTGAVLKGVLISLSGAGSATTFTDVSGNYSFPGLINGSYSAIPTLAGYSFNPVSRSAIINGANDTFGDLVSAQGSIYTISGSVSGATLAGVAINLTGDATKSTQTDANGNYSITGLTSGSYTLTPVLSGFTFIPGNTAVAVTNANVSVPSFVETANAAPTYTISGNVTGPVLKNVLITLGSAGSATTLTNATGYYIFSGLVNGNYSVAASKAGYVFSPLSPTVIVSGANVANTDFKASGGYKLNDTGITDSQCYAAGVSMSFSACNSTGATTLSLTQDGILGRDANLDTNNNIDGYLGFSFSAVSGGCVQDNVTGLMWEGKTSGNAITKYNIADASNYLSAVNTVGLCGYNDWRMPTPEELVSLIDYSNVSGALIDPIWFPNTQSGAYWTGTTYNSFSTTSPQTWVVYFSLGGGFLGNEPGVSSNNTYLNTTANYVQLVRGAAVPAPSFVLNGAEATDQSTGLIWKRCAEGMTYAAGNCTGTAATYTLESALQLATGQTGGWRLPNVKELASIIDRSVAGRAFDLSVFPANPINLYRTTTPRADFPGYAQFISFRDGSSYALDTSYLYYVRLVR